MLIGIDGNEANMDERVGVNQYSWELLNALAKLEGKWKSKHKIIVYLKENPKDFMPKSTKYFFYKILPGKNVWIITKLTPELLFARAKPDIFFSPNHYTPPISTVPIVVTIHDLGYLVFSEHFRKSDFWQLKFWSAWSIFISKHIISVSIRTKEDIVRHYPFASKKVTVVHHGFDASRFNQSIREEDVRRIKEKYSIVKDYVLYLGTLKPSKNIEGLIDAWKLIYSKFPNYKLVIAGKKGWMFESIFEKVKKLGLTENVIFTDFVSEEDKPPLIRGAKVFILPSFWEGFGMDILNAYACGVPVVASKIGPIPEVAGNSAIYINPSKIESIASGIKKVLSASEKQYNKLVKLCIESVKRFSWQNTAQETLKVLEVVHNK